MRRNLGRWASRGVAIVLLIGTAHLVGRGQFASAPPGAMGGGLGDDVDVDVEYAPRVYFREAVTGPAAETHRLLNKSIAFPFANETPLADFLAHVRQETAEDGHPAGVPIYIDPVGLLEADRTPQSPVVLDLHSAPVGRGLGLVLDQLDLAYTVEPDGLIIICSADGKERMHDPLPYILDELRALREEVKDLKAAVGTKTED